MNELKIFENEQFGKIRTVEVDGTAYFVGKDVAEVLGYSNPRKALIDHVDEEDKTDGVTIRDSIGREQTPIFINESGLYSLILSSKLPKAKEFKRWVTSEVLPAIRKHGVYAVDEVLENPDMLISALQALKEEKAKAKALTEKIEADKPKVLFADSVTTAKTSILVRELAKILKQNGIETGEKRLFQWLRSNGYLISRKGADYNMPTQRSMDLGLFEIKESAVDSADSKIIICKTAKVTGKGQVYFINKFLKEET